MASGCRSTRPEAPEPATPALPELEGQALLLLLEDRRLYEPLTVEQALRGDSASRERLALALGRMGQPEATALLEELVRDDAVAVRRMAAFALRVLAGRGKLAELDWGPGSGLFLAAADSDLEVSRWALEALGEAGLGLTRLGEVLGEVPDPAASELLLDRLLPGLHVYPDDGARASLALLALEELGKRPDDAVELVELRRRAAFALFRRPLPGLEGAARRLLAHDTDPWIRGWAAAALGPLGSAEDLPQLRALALSAQPGDLASSFAAARALAAAGRLLRRGLDAPPPSWREDLALWLASSSAGLRQAAHGIADLWLLDEELGAQLQAAAQAGEDGALLALARGQDPRAVELVLRESGATDPRRRVAAARAAAWLGQADVLERLSADERPLVRRAALLESLERSTGEARSRLAQSVLEDPSPVVRTAGYAFVAQLPLLPVERLEQGLTGPQRPTVELRLAALAALAQRARSEPLERGACVAALEQFGRDGSFAVRQAAAAELVSLARPEPAIGGLEARSGMAYYRQLAERTSVDWRVTIETRHGSLLVELFCRFAPQTCVSFLQLAGQGFFDGLAFYELVPGELVRTGDPLDGGGGGPGYLLRDEITPVRFDRPGVIGLERTVPDAGGSRFFITLAPLPQLDGRAVAFGRVLAGIESLDLIASGDAIERLVVAQPAAPRGGGDR